MSLNLTAFCTAPIITRAARRRRSPAAWPPIPSAGRKTPRCSIRDCKKSSAPCEVISAQEESRRRQNCDRKFSRAGHVCRMRDLIVKKNKPANGLERAAANLGFSPGSFVHLLVAGILGAAQRKESGYAEKLFENTVSGRAWNTRPKRKRRIRRRPFCRQRRRWTRSCATKRSWNGRCPGR